MAQIPTVEQLAIIRECNAKGLTITGRSDREWLLALLDEVLDAVGDCENRGAELEDGYITMPKKDFDALRSLRKKYGRTE